MKRQHFFLTITSLALMTAAPVFAQGPAPANGNKPVPVLVRFLDGSTVYVQMKPQPIAIETAFGKLSVPAKHIDAIEFGMHLDDAELKEIAQWIDDLGSPVNNQQMQAVKNLAAKGEKAYVMLKHATKSAEKDVSRLSIELVKAIEKAVPKKMLDRPLEDKIHTDKFTIVGRLTAPFLAGQATAFGEIKLRPAQLMSMHWLGGPGGLTVALDAAQYGSEAGQWRESNFRINYGDKLKITATGQVNLWPQGGSQYITGPDGRDGSIFRPYAAFGPKVGNAGALIGKVGEKGQPFYIGSQLNGASDQAGTLFLHIVPNPWGVTSEGGYQVKIRRELP